jgi:hypothetical protein
MRADPQHEKYATELPVTFGPQGSIHTEEECAAAQGLWIPVVLEWMTHVYPNEPQRWGGMHMGVEAGE